MYYSSFINYECDVMSKRKNRPKTIPTNIQDLKYKFKGGFASFYGQNSDLTAQTAQLDLVPPATASAKICSSGTAIALSNTKKEWEHFSEHKMLTGEVLWSFDTFVLEIHSTSLGRVKYGKITCLRQKMLTEKIYIKPTVGLNVLLTKTDVQLYCHRIVFWREIDSSYTSTHSTQTQSSGKWQFRMLCPTGHVQKK